LKRRDQNKKGDECWEKVGTQFKTSWPEPKFMDLPEREGGRRGCIRSPRARDLGAGKKRAFPAVGKKKKRTIYKREGVTGRLAEPAVKKRETTQDNMFGLSRDETRGRGEKSRPRNRYRGKSNLKKCIGGQGDQKPGGAPEKKRAKTSKKKNSEVKNPGIAEPNRPAAPATTGYRTNRFEDQKKQDQEKLEPRTASNSPEKGGTNRKMRLATRQRLEAEGAENSRAEGKNHQSRSSSRWARAQNGKEEHP